MAFCGILLVFALLYRWQEYTLLCPASQGWNEGHDKGKKLLFSFKKPFIAFKKQGKISHLQGI